MKRLVILTTIVGALFCGCCCHKKCVKNQDQAEKSKIEAQKAMDEMDKEIPKDDGK